MSYFRLWTFMGLLIALSGAAALFARQRWHDQILAQQHGLGQVHGGKWLKRLAVRTSDYTGPRVDEGSDAHADLPSGFYRGPLKVQLTSEAGAPIRYTLDGSTPSDSSALYESPILLQRTATLRFRSFPADDLPGPVALRSYVIDADYGLPVFSLVIDPVHLWNRHSGIYTNWEKRGARWQRPAAVDYVRDGRALLQFAAQAQIHGNWSRQATKKSFQLSYASGALGAKPGAELLKPLNSGANRSTILRAAAIDVNYRLGHDLFQSMFASAGGLVPQRAMVMLLLNGDPWGLYYLQDKIDENYLRERFGADDYEIAEYPEERNRPNPLSWQRLLDRVAARNLADPAEFGAVEQLIDIENLTDYWLFNIYAGNMDWPHNNYFAFRSRAGNQRWRWVSWDTDSAFRSAEHKTLEWALRDQRRDDLAYLGDGRHTDHERFVVTTQIVRNLLRNRGYRERFYARFKQLLGADFAPAPLQARFDRLLSQMVPHLAVDWTRWPRSQQNFALGVNNVRRFIEERPARLRRHFQQYFDRSD